MPAALPAVIRRPRSIPLLKTPQGPGVVGKKFRRQADVAVRAPKKPQGAWFEGDGSVVTIVTGLLRKDFCYAYNSLNDTKEAERNKSGKSDQQWQECFAYWEAYWNKSQYYRTKRLRVHWSRTLNEDLADNTGLQTAFKAYTKVLEEECAGQDTHLKDLETFDGMQLFFILRAMTMCKIADKYSLNEDIRKVKFSSPQKRVNVPLKNLDEFGKAFNCSLGSPMHPYKNETCSLW
ncbi:phosphate-regulating neutral endopeptidase PHEX-like [Dermacentor andersoni]|uniref:phosphate-regulating neutral endopeptidase PHEX-like n=1 Tax=Dermacentor andersoni TaxID=34620 RepID=UPI003B3A63CA